MEPKLKVKIKRIDKTLPLPIYQTTGSVAVDMYSREDLVIGPRQIGLAPSNLVIETPPGYFLMIASRSSLPLKKGLTLANAVGVVDQDFCGDNDEIKIALLNLTDQPVNVGRGERIAQGLLVKIGLADWEEVDKMQATDRGGFGSTG